MDNKFKINNNLKMNYNNRKTMKCHWLMQEATIRRQCTKYHREEFFRIQNLCSAKKPQQLRVAATCNSKTLFVACFPADEIDRSRSIDLSRSTSTTPVGRGYESSASSEQIKTCKRRNNRSSANLQVLAEASTRERFDFVLTSTKSRTWV